MMVILQKKFHRLYKSGFSPLFYIYQLLLGMSRAGGWPPALDYVPFNAKLRFLFFSLSIYFCRLKSQFLY